MSTRCPTCNQVLVKKPRSVSNKILEYAATYKHFTDKDVQHFSTGDNKSKSVNVLCHLLVKQGKLKIVQSGKSGMYSRPVIFSLKTRYNL